MLNSPVRVTVGVVLLFVILGYILDDPSPSSTSTSAQEEPATEAVDEQDRPQEPELTPEERAQEHWHAITRVSEIDDSTNVQLSRPSHRITRDTIGGAVIPRLFINCRENSTSIYVFWDRFISTQNTNVLVRIDDEPAKTHRWNISTGNNSTGLWRGSGIPFIKSLFGKDQLLVEVTPYGADAQRAVFNITDLELAIQPLRQSCNW